MILTKIRYTVELTDGSIKRIDSTVDANGDVDQAIELAVRHADLRIPEGAQVLEIDVIEE